MSKINYISAVLMGKIGKIVKDIADVRKSAAAGAPTKVTLVSQMTDTDKNYLYIGSEAGYTSGHVYYYVDGNLTDGGAYGGVNIDNTLSVSGQAADAKVTGDKIEGIKEDLSALEEQITALTGTSSTTRSGEIIYTLSEDDLAEVKSIESESDLTFYSKNIFDQSTKVAGKIINDSGVETNDNTSHYYSQLIPVKGKKIIANFKIQKLYLYDSTKTLISRTSSSKDPNSAYTPDSNVYFISVQLYNGDAIDNMCMWYGETAPTYSAYRESDSWTGFSGDVNVIADGINTFSMTITTPNNIDDVVKPIVKNVIGDISDTVTYSETGYVVTLPAELVKRASSMNIPSEVFYFGENIFDKSTRVRGKIKNDSGVEVSDNLSNYFAQYIPCYGEVLTANFNIQKLYLFDSSKNLISRINGYTAGKSISIPTSTYFVQVQVLSANITDSMAIAYGTVAPIYSEYYITSSMPNTGSSFSIVKDGITTLTVSITAVNVKAVLPSVKTYPIWEPSTATDDYKCDTLGQDIQSIPALNTLGWFGFLATYFDIYLGTYSDGYSVTREDFGLDSGAEATGNIASPVYVYTFSPKYYNKTVILSAGMNTCEASTYFGLAYFIKGLMEEHTDAGLLALYNTTRFIVMPVICPSGIAHDPLLYPNSNNVRVNKNFEYYGSWERLKLDRGGPYPDSEIETKILKRLLNRYPNSALYMDCHSDTGAYDYIRLHLLSAFCSDSTTRSLLDADKQKIIDFYKDKGYYTASDSPTCNFIIQDKTSAIYPKTVYAKEVTGTPAVMTEQYVGSSAWGSTGHTNNDSYGIKHYATIIRYIVLIMCRDSIKVIL